MAFCDFPVWKRFVFIFFGAQRDVHFRKISENQLFVSVQRINMRDLGILFFLSQSRLLQTLPS